ncbi:MAG TPA: hypothetical protein P5531_07145 [Bacteroidales bacterium]|nr:hypothetical protein [Bacteroidales bacterium]HSA43340.1 hypothetical protein [Bacteroidales bacterium]
MASKKEKTGYLLLGVFFGLIIAASFLWWQNNFLRKDWISFHKIGHFISGIFDSKTDVLTLTENDTKSGMHADPKNQLESRRNDTSDARLDSLLMMDADSLSYYLAGQGMEYYIETEAGYDTLINVSNRKRSSSKNDSLESDTSTTQGSMKQGEPDIEVRRDRFLLSRSYRIAGSRDSLRNPGKLDSILTNNVRTFRQAPNIMRIEFWKSPVNYTGYKMSNNKIILFGNFDPDQISLELVNHKILLHYKNNTFNLVAGDQFQPLSNSKQNQ